MKTGTNVKTISLLSILSFIILASGLVMTFQDQLASHSHSPQKTDSLTTTIDEKNDEIYVVALGDSLTRGTGDENGKGYVGYTVEQLRKITKKEVRVNNLAIKGLVSNQLLKQLEQLEIQRQIKQADIILMTIGGNDLFQGGQALTMKSLEQVKPVKEKFLHNLEMIFQTIRGLNKDAYIFYIGLYNPFNDLSDKEISSAIVRDWNFSSFEVAAKFPFVVAVPTYDLFELQVNDFLYVDKFHPNSKGYERIGERVASLLPFSKGGNDDESS